MPFITRRQQHIDIRLNLRVLQWIGAVGVAVCLYLTVHFHNTLNVDKPLSVRRLSPQPTTVISIHGAAAATDGMPPRNTGNANTQRAVVTNDHATIAAAKTKTLTSSNAEEGVSACLLVNDENPRLPEWIAYHYLTLPLVSLIVAVDPASRSSPSEILLQWKMELKLDVHLWPEKRYLPKSMRGPCPTPDDANKCLWHHRDRQQHFVNRCMAEHKRLNRTWVLLTDVDEYLVFNQARKDDPVMPSDEAPEGIPIMSSWKYHTNGDMTIPDLGGVVDGMVNGKYWRTMPLKPETDVDYGNVVVDVFNQKHFLRDDVAHLESTSLTEAPPGVPTATDPLLAGKGLYVKIYNDTYDNNADGAFVPIVIDWKIGDKKRRNFYGGHLFTDTKGRKYFMENEHKFWPPHYLTKYSMAARARLPSVDDGTTVLDVLKAEAKEDYVKGALGPCLSIPRLLYGSREDETKNSTAAPEGFDEKDFVTLRYRYHAPKGEFEASKFGKTIIDVSRVPIKSLQTKALNIHRPLTYYCRKDPMRYSVSLFRVNHYLDSFEAYSYRNDARSTQRHCKECYEKKGERAAVAVDDDIQPWLRRFVELVGHEKAQKLLSKAGEFAKLE